jgi:hypothetical protein
VKSYHHNVVYGSVGTPPSPSPSPSLFCFSQFCIGTAKPLKSDSNYMWQVQWWDANGMPSPYSEVKKRKEERVVRVR